MRTFITTTFTLGALFITLAGVSADDYIKDGKLTQQLKITQLQGGFAGFTGFEYVIEADGTWTMGSVFQRKTTPKGNGKLTAKELEQVAAIMKKYDLEKLPENAGKKVGANPHTITIEFGKVKSHHVGQM